MQKRFDKVNRPDHYVDKLPDGHEVETVDILRMSMTPEEFRGWAKGNAIAYLLRANKKNGEEDMRKARKTLQLWEGK